MLESALERHFAVKHAMERDFVAIAGGVSSVNGLGDLMVIRGVFEQ